MADRERALHLLMGRYRYEEAMRLFGEYCLLLEEDWSDFSARHSPLRLRQIHKQLSAVGLWPVEYAPPVRGTGLLAQASKAVTGLLGGLRAPEEQAVVTEVAHEPQEAVMGRDPEMVLHSLASPAIAIDLANNLSAHAALGLDASPLQEAIAAIRYRLAQDLGFVLPLVHVRANGELAENRYALRLAGQTVAEGKLQADHVAVLGPDLPPGMPTEPHPSREVMIAWMTPEVARSWRGASQAPVTLLAEHLESVARRYSDKLLTNQVLDQLLRAYESEIGKDTYTELFGRFMSMTELRLVLQAMLKNGYSVRNLPRIVDILMNHFINYLAEKPLSMDETWKISSHIPFFATEELTRVVCQGLGLPPIGDHLASLTAALERVVREPDAQGFVRDGWERSKQDPGKGAT
ncbi:MAG TPA: FHIPEP family type III secretion protein [Oscillatoriaceae cyanobacterium]